MIGWGDRPIKVVMVGTGFVAPFHAAGWRHCPNVQVSAAVTRNPDASASRLADLAIPRGYRTLEEAIDREQPDVIDICSPPERHLQDAEVAISTGIAFMCQKPLASNYEDAKTILDTASAKSVRAMVHENFRFRAWNRVLKSSLEDGAVGKPFFARSVQRMAGTVLTADNPERPWSLKRQPQFATQSPFLILESVIHQIDVARYLFGEPSRIFARCRRVSPHVVAEDTALVMLCFDDMEVQIERSYASKGYEPPASGGGESLVVEGDEGTAFLSPGGNIRIVRDNAIGREERAIAVDTQDAYARSYSDCIAQFVTRLRSGQPFETSLDDNLKTLRAVFAAYQSVETGEAVNLLKFDEGKD